MKSVRILGLAALLLTACTNDTPAPVELRGVGTGETFPSANNTAQAPQPMDTTQSIASGTYQPPAGYAAPAQGIQTQSLGEPTDAYSQAATNQPITAPTTINPTAGAVQPLGQTK